METKRLFVGGLYNDIKEVDLRDRFKTFGTVSSVEVIRRTDEKGCTIKTFAYIDMLQTEKDFKRCVSLLSNSKWRGCCLKIQAAKESFLTRLQRERQQQVQTSVLSPLHKDTKQNSQKGKEAHPEKDTQNQHAIPEILPKAVPGTPLPGKKNWVVGKFGRVLPVMYLRRRDRKKIAKFDPSKTTHCLKKIKPEDSDPAVSQLTWTLDSEEHMVNVNPGNLLKMKGKNRHKEQITDKEQIKSFRTNKYLDKPVKTVREDTLSNDSSDGDNIESNSSDSNSGIDKYSQYSDTKPIRYTTNCIKGNSLDKACVIPVRSSSNNKGNIEEALCTIPQEEVKLLSDMSEVESSSATKMLRKNSSLKSNEHFSLHNGTCTLQVEEEYEHSTDGNSTTASEGNSSDSPDNTSDTESTESESVIKTGTDQMSPTINSNSSKISYNSDNSDSKGILIRSARTIRPEVADSPQKQKHSNDKRLDALLEKRKSAQAQKNLIKDALKDLDNGTQSSDGKKHIVFSDSDESASEDKEVKKAAYSVGDKISGSKASSWLGLDSDSDDDSDHAGHHSAEENNQLVTVKPHFEGKSGEELFKLQRTYGGDKRFDLDSRFLESEEEDGDDHQVNSDYRNKDTAKGDAQKTLSRHYEGSIPTEKEDDISKSVQEEKQMAMKVLSNILGGDFKADYGSRGSTENVPEFRSSTLVHYDPTREDHKQFEQITEKETEKPDARPTLVQEKQSEETALPEVSQDKYYEANTSVLANFFGSKKEGTSFTFLSQEQDDDVNSSSEDVTHMGVVERIKSNPWQATPKLRYDSSDDDGDESDDDIELNDTVHTGINPSNSTSQLDELFFFHPDDPILANRINDQEAPYMRTMSQEEVSGYWVSVRSDLTQDYKKKRKDAVRRQNKLAAKRPRYR